MKKTTIVEPLPWNGLNGLYLKSDLRMEQECTLVIDHDWKKAEIKLDKSDIRKLVEELQAILNGKVAHAKEEQDNEYKT